MEKRRSLTVRGNAQSGCAAVRRLLFQAELCAAYPMFETAYDCLVDRCSSDKYYNKLE